MIDTVQKVGDLSRDGCRTHVEDHFSTTRMAEMYETVYRPVMTEKFDDADAGVRRSNYNAIGDEVRSLPRIQHPSPLAQMAGSGVDLGVVGAGRTVGSA